jgi:hypothetical protein
VDNLYLVTPEEIPTLLRWIATSERAGYMGEEQARDWRARVVAWRSWLEFAVQPVL